tara:strand:- start:83 stop:424 length:342 start_codon:yes stop_codon:yes gene_type:complete
MTTLEIKQIIDNIQNVYSFFEEYPHNIDWENNIIFIDSHIAKLKSYLTLDMLNKDYKITNQRFLLERHIIKEEIRYFLKNKETDEVSILQFIKDIHSDLNSFITRFLLVLTQN